MPSPSRDCEISEEPNELIIQVRWIPRLLGAILLGVLFPFFGLMIWTQEHKTAFVILTIVLSYPALLIALNWYCLRVTPENLRIVMEPVPFIRRAPIACSDVCGVFCALTRTQARGGYVERYSLQVNLRNGRVAVLLDARLEGDTRAAAEALTDWLNAHRDPRLSPVTLRPSDS